MNIQSSHVQSEVSVDNQIIELQPSQTTIPPPLSSLSQETNHIPFYSSVLPYTPSTYQIPIQLQPGLPPIPS